MTRHGLLKKSQALLVSGIGAGIVSVVILIVSASHFASASPGFNASNIMSDSVFTNKGSMSIAQIQHFFESKGSVCLANFKTLSINDSDNNGLGDEPYGKGVNEQVSAATAIWQAAQIYNINPQVIIATLQKEQGLVTRTDCPEWRYNTALGYGCPDSQPCSTAAYGFSRQIDYGTWHFRGFFLDTYPVPPTIPGAKFIAYNPNGSACGGSVINIENRATAALYSYTPYQPNAATLAASAGQTVHCGAYGNINFWRYFTSWFGSTQYEEPLLLFKSHVGYVGWTNTNINRGMMGTTGQGKTIEAFKIQGEVEYSSYTHEDGWQPTVLGGMISGTTGQKKSVQAIKIKTTGTLATQYDVWYRAHVSYVGWMGWTRNEQAAGVTGDATRNIEAIEIQLLPKNANPPGSTSNPYQNSGTTTRNAPLSLAITSHIGSVGWTPAVTDGMTTGFTEQSRRIEAFKVDLTNTTGLSGGILYSAHVSTVGWQGFRTSGETAGTTGAFKKVEAARLLLTDQLAENYDIWYRGYVQYMGWLGWAKNGDPAGSVGSSRQLEALEVRLVPKDSITLPQGGLHNPQNLAAPDYGIEYSAHVNYAGWTPSVVQEASSGTTGQSRHLEAVRMDAGRSIEGDDLAINCLAYVKGTGWTSAATPGNACGTTGQSKPIEGVRLSLSGAAAAKYDVYYRTHVAFLGWQGWVKNDEVSGIPNTNKSIEAVIVKVVKK